MVMVPTMYLLDYLGEEAQDPCAEAGHQHGAASDIGEIWAVSMFPALSTGVTGELRPA